MLPRKKREEVGRKPSLSLSVEGSQKAGATDGAHNNASQDVFQDILDNIIDESYITRLTGCTDCQRMTHLQLSIDTNNQSILSLPDFLPNLQSLVLDNSVIASIRDLGVGLRHLLSLSMNECGLSDLDGIGVLLGLQDLNVGDNFLTDLSPLAMHENLQRLNVSGNNLKDLSLADALSTCPQLSSLFLSRNPITRAPNYRLIIASMISTLEKLDGTPADSQAASIKVTNAMVLEAASAMQSLEEDLDDDRRLELAITADLSSQQQQNSQSTMSPTGMMLPDTGSELTHGSTVVLAGNMAAAMRKRRNKLAADHNSTSQGHSHSNSNSNSRGGSADATGMTASVSGGAYSEEWSALEVLDAALKPSSQYQQQHHRQNNHETTNDPSHNHHSRHNHPNVFLGEGDITEQVLGASASQLQRPKAAPQSPSMSNPQQLQSHSRKTMQHNNHGVNDGNNKAKTSRSVDTAARQAASANSETNGGNATVVSRSVSAAFPSHMRQQQLHGQQDKQQQQWAYSSFDSEAPAIQSSHQYHSASSPRQLNSSRPPTATTAVAPSMFAMPDSNGGIADECAKGKTDVRLRLASRKGARSFTCDDNSKGNGNDVYIRESSFGGGLYSVDPLMLSPMASPRLNYYNATNGSEMDESSSLDLTAYVLQRTNSNKNSNRSIVHLDVVKRNMMRDELLGSTSKQELESLRSGGLATACMHMAMMDEAVIDLDDVYEDTTPNKIDNDNDSSDEDICITHAARHRLMSASTRTRKRDPPTQKPIPAHAHTHTHTQPQALAQAIVTAGKGPEADDSPTSHSVIDDLNRDGIVVANRLTTKRQESVNANVRNGGSQSPRPLSAASSAANTPRSTASSHNLMASATGKETVASKAGKSLGFDLVGSLALIGQWVDLDEDDNDGDDKNKEKEKPKTNLSVTKSKETLTATAAIVSRDNLLKKFAAGDSSTPRLAPADDTITVSRDHTGASSNGGSGASVHSSSSKTTNVTQTVTVKSTSDRSSRHTNSNSSSNSNGVAISATNRKPNPLALPLQQRSQSHSNSNSNSQRQNYKNIENASESSDSESSAVLSVGSDVSQGSHKNGDNRKPSNLSKQPRRRKMKESVDARSIHNHSSSGGNPSNAPIPTSVTPAKSKATGSKKISTAPSAVDRDEPLLLHTPTSVIVSDSSKAIEAASLSLGLGPNTVLGEGVYMEDALLVEMLQKPPKLVPALRTKSSFQAFFRGVQKARMRNLLEQAYRDTIGDEKERLDKVNKRLDLLKEILT